MDNTEHKALLLRATEDLNMELLMHKHPARIKKILDELRSLLAIYPREPGEQLAYIGGTMAGPLFRLVDPRDPVGPPADGCSYLLSPLGALIEVKLFSEEWWSMQGAVPMMTSNLKHSTHPHLSYIAAEVYAYNGEFTTLAATMMVNINVARYILNISPVARSQHVELAKALAASMLTKRAAEDAAKEMTDMIFNSTQ